MALCKSNRTFSSLYLNDRLAFCQKRVIGFACSLSLGTFDTQQDTKPFDSTSAADVDCSDVSMGVAAVAAADELGFSSLMAAAASAAAMTVPCPIAARCEKTVLHSDHAAKTLFEEEHGHGDERVRQYSHDVETFEVLGPTPCASSIREV